MSVWQTPQATSRTSTSPAFGSARSTSWTDSGWPNSSSTAARIFMRRSLMSVRLRPLPGGGAERADQRMEGPAVRGADLGLEERGQEERVRGQLDALDPGVLGARADHQPGALH